MMDGESESQSQHNTTFVWLFKSLRKHFGFELSHWARLLSILSATPTAQGNDRLILKGQQPMRTEQWLSDQSWKLTTQSLTDKRIFSPAPSSSPARNSAAVKEKCLPRSDTHHTVIYLTVSNKLFNSKQGAKTGIICLDCSSKTWDNHHFCTLRTQCRLVWVMLSTISNNKEKALGFIWFFFHVNHTIRIA